MTRGAFFAAFVAVICAGAACGLTAVGTVSEVVRDASTEAVPYVPPIEAAPYDAGNDAPACAADLTVDPTNCGKCGHDCQGGTCVDGACQPTIFVMNEPGIVGIEVIGNELYWTRPSAGLVRAMPLDKSASARTITDRDAGGLDQPWGIADFNETLLLTDRANGLVARYGFDGGRHWERGVFATPSGVASDGTAVFFTIQDQDSVLSVQMDGGGPPDGSTRVTGLDYPWSVAVAGGVIYVASSNGIHSAPEDGGTPVFTVSPVERFQDGGDLIHAGIGVDGDTVFFTLTTLGLVASVPTKGGTATVLAAGQSAPGGLDVSPTAIYWVNAGDGVVMKLAR